MQLDPRLLIAGILAVSSWIMPEPQYSQGMILVYGNQRLVEANAAFHGYDLSKMPGRCGFATISPAHLGQIAYITIDGVRWIKCLVVDVDGRDDAWNAIAVRHEIGEISFADAAWLGLKHNAQGWQGARGRIWFGACLPSASGRLMPQPQAYAPPLVQDTWGEWTPSFYPYPLQQAVVDCNHPFRRGNQ